MTTGTGSAIVHADAGGGVAAAGGGTYCQPIALRQDAEVGAVDRRGPHDRHCTPGIGARGVFRDHVDCLRERQPVTRAKSLNPTEPKEISILCRRSRRREREPQCSRSERSRDAERSRVRLRLAWRDAQGCRRRRDTNHSCGNDYGHDHEERKKKSLTAEDGHGQACAGLQTPSLNVRPTRDYGTEWGLQTRR